MPKRKPTPDTTGHTRRQTFRLDPEMVALLDRLAAHYHVDKTAVVRLALVRLADLMPPVFDPELRRKKNRKSPKNSFDSCHDI